MAQPSATKRASTKAVAKPKSATKRKTLTAAKPVATKPVATKPVATRSVAVGRARTAKAPRATKAAAAVLEAPELLTASAALAPVAPVHPATGVQAIDAPADPPNAVASPTEPSANAESTHSEPPAPPAVRPIFRRVGAQWRKFDPSDLEGIAKADADAAELALLPAAEVAVPVPPARQEHSRGQRRRQHSRAAVATADVESESSDSSISESDQVGDDDAGDRGSWSDRAAHGGERRAAEPEAPIEDVSGILDLSNQEPRLRQFSDKGFVATPDDPAIPPEYVQQFNLRTGNLVVARAQMRRSRRRRGPNRLRRTIIDIASVEGMAPQDWARRTPYGDLTSIDPQPRLQLEYRGCPPACRLIDLFCPIGYGTRGLIVAPPKAGKTILLQQIAHGIKHNHPAVELIALLIDERPEEVTDFRRNVPALVLASSNDQDLEKHTQMGIMAIERARRLFEAGKDVVVLLDSLTRLGRAFNNNRRYSSGGRTMSGGLDSRALEVPKQLFGAARKAEEGGSLTIIATCLVDTGSRADQVIFEEFKGTGNMELILDRSISERRVFPAINLAASGTRKEHLLMGDRELKTMTALRRRLMSMPPFVQVEQLVAAVNRTPDNETLVKGSGA